LSVTFGAPPQQPLSCTRSLIAQALDVASLRLTGETHPVADPVAKVAIIAGTNVAVSASGLLLYGSSNTSSRFSWLDRTGKLVGEVGEPGEYSTFRLSPDGRRAAISRDGPWGTDLWLLIPARCLQPVHLSFRQQRIPDLVSGRPNDFV
jgi:hypothetical protein